MKIFTKKRNNEYSLAFCSAQLQVQQYVVLPKSTKQNLFENDNLGQPMSHPSNMPESKDKCQLECQADEFIHSGVKISDFDA